MQTLYAFTEVCVDVCVSSEKTCCCPCLSEHSYSYVLLFPQEKQSMRSCLSRVRHGAHFLFINSHFSEFRRQQLCDC